jgi:hypothetical protein
MGYNPRRNGSGRYMMKSQVNGSTGMDMIEPTRRIARIRSGLLSKLNMVMTLFQILGKKSETWNA